MHRTPLALFLTLLAAPAMSDERQPFHGIWGTPQQCSHMPIKPGGTVRAMPFRIDGEWLRQGGHWCRLEWFPVQHRDGKAFTAARAFCGEDSVRDYYLRMELDGDALTLRWDMRIANGPLGRCPSS